MTTSRMVTAAVLLMLLELCGVDAYPPPVPMLFPDCVSGPLSHFPICDPALPLPTRIADLLSRMNLTEKSPQPQPRIALLTITSPCSHACSLCLVCMRLQVPLAGQQRA
jgi:hypothetical protein